MKGLPTETRFKGTLETDQVKSFSTAPLAPREVQVTASFLVGSLDVRWENPNSISENQALDVVGVNIYRSYDDELGNYTKINAVPLGALFYRDSTELVYQENEPVTWLSRGSNPRKEWVFQVAHVPIIKPSSQAEISYKPVDIVFKISGTPVRVKQVVGHTGEVFLFTTGWWDHSAQNIIEATLPSLEDVTTCSYYWNKGLIVGHPNRRIFYRVTSVLEDDTETPLSETLPHSVEEVEKLDYIWREAVRRNAWILDQGGERVLVFLRRWLGSKCSCYDYDMEQAKATCEICYGTGVVGGYDGPYSLIISPSDADRKRKWAPQGFIPEKAEEVWTGPSPVLTHWDFIVKQNGERCSIGSVRIPMVRGARLQQHIQIGLLQDHDVRYKVPINGSDQVVPIADTGYTQSIGSEEEPVGPPPGSPLPEDLTDASPVITENPDIPEGKRKKGRTVTFDNLVY
jgi:hypothetical protein